MQYRKSKRRPGAALAVVVGALLLALPAVALGHDEELPEAELLGTLAASSPEPLKGGNAEGAAPDMTIGEVPLQRSEIPETWYRRGRVAPRIGSSADDRYTLAGGCFSLQTGQGDAADGAVYRFQPTGLGSYLLLGPGGKFPTVAGDELDAVERPSRRAEWVVEGDATNGFEFTARDGAGLGVGNDGQLKLGEDGERFELGAAPSCLAFPEIAVNATGRPSGGKPVYGQSRGTIDLHSHFMAFEGFGRGLHCGRPWHPLGVASALVDCPDHAPNGTGAFAANMLVFQDPSRTHDPGGWPTFAGWPTYEWVFTHEQTYYKWIERAWRGGLRLMTLLAVDNSAACLINVYKTESCNEMDAVRRQIAAAKELQAYIDAQAGGPGKGFFRIVKNPFQARKVINRGKLAIVLGVEVSEPLDCGLRNGVPQCDREDVDAGLDEMFASGVRQMEIVNKFDNAFTGVAMDGGFQGPVLNSANKQVTGEFWDVETCTGTDSDREQVTSVPEAAAELIALLPGGAAKLPVYPDPPHCNKKGLSDLGRFLIRGMAKRKMIFDPDHMSVYARTSALDLIDALDYSGIVSSHSWADRTSYRRVMELGGVVTPMAGDADEFDNEWNYQRELYREGRKRSRRYGFGFGFGDDMNGFGGPRDPTAGTSAEINYPFKSPIDPKVTLDRQQSGEKTFDLNTDGVAHFGQWPDWTEGVRLDAGRKVIRDLRGGVEAYLRMWERSVGIRGPHGKRRSGRTGATGLARIKLNMRPKKVLRKAGQPATRTRGWSWRVRHTKRAKLGAAFTGKGRVGLVVTTARGYRAGGVRNGFRASALRGFAKPLGRGVWVRGTRRGNRFVYGLRRGKVSFVGVGTKRSTITSKRIARLVRLALHRR